MHKEERFRYILDRLNQDNRVFVSELSRKLKVSDDTLRRDLAELSRAGELTQVRGGAIAKSEIPLQFDERREQALLAKRQMAAKLVGLFREGDVILMDGGTTHLEVARMLPKGKRFTVYTNCLPIAIELSANPLIETILFGGQVLASSQVTVGMPVYQMLRTVYPDWTIVGVSDIHPEKGLTTDNREEAIIKRCMVAQGGKRVVFAGSEKLDRARSFFVASLSEIDYIITENGKVDYIKRNWPPHSYQVL